MVLDFLVNTMRIYGTKMNKYYNLLKNWLEYKQTLKQLNSLSDHQLKDIGLTRNDIYDIANSNKEV